MFFQIVHTTQIHLYTSDGAILNEFKIIQYIPVETTISSHTDGAWLSGVQLM